jgi:hypothetical protein
VELVIIAVVAVKMTAVMEINTALARMAVVRPRSQSVSEQCQHLFAQI